MSEVERAKAVIESELDKAMTAKDKPKVKALMGELDKLELAERKAQAEKAKVEFDAKAAARLELTTKVKIELDKLAGQFKTEITKLVGEDNAMLLYSINYKTGDVNVKITSQVVGLAKTGNGGPRVSSQDMIGMGLDECYQAFKTPEDDAEFAKVAVDNAGDAHKINSGQWRVKDKVRKRAIAQGLVTANK